MLLKMILAIIIIKKKAIIKIKVANKNKIIKELKNKMHKKIKDKNQFIIILSRMMQTIIKINNDNN